MANLALDSQFLPVNRDILSLGEVPPCRWDVGEALCGRLATPLFAASAFAGSANVIRFTPHRRQDATWGKAGRKLAYRAFRMHRAVQPEADIAAAS